MELKDILLDKKYKLPHSYDSNSNFRKYILTKLDSFKDDIQAWYDEQDVTQKKNYERRITKLSEIIVGLQNAINEYYNGFPHKSYETYKEILNELALLSIIPQTNINRDIPLFRVRVGKKEEIQERKNIFHVPFDKRTKISVQRYSIAGFPSLYLGNSIYTAWEELGRPSLDEMFFAKFQIRFDSPFLNLSTEFFYKDIETIQDESLLDKVLLFPIFFVNSIGVNNRQDPFKPEYIFPQFTLRWCREQDKFTGIIYRSTRIHHKSKGVFYNVVMPVIFSCENDKDEPLYCSDLAKLMYLTKPVNITNIQDVSPVGAFEIDEIYSKELADNIKFNISTFAKAETFLLTETLDTLET